MQIEASVGNAPRAYSLADGAYSLRLVAQTEGDRQRLAALFRALTTMPPAVRRTKPPVVTISEKDELDRREENP